MKRATSFIDLLFLLSLGLMLLFFITLTLINPKAKNQDVKLDAQAIINITWGKNLNSDIDLLVKAPDGTLVFYNRPNGPFLSLERDDRGKYNDYIRLKTGKVISYDLNKETVAIRKLLPGVYKVQVLLFQKKDEGFIQVSASLDKLNPVFTTYADTIVSISTERQQKTLFSFTVDDNGDIVDVNKRPLQPFSIKGIPNDG